MPRISFNLTERDGEENIFLFVQGELEPKIAHSSHPPFAQIKSECERLAAKQNAYEKFQSSWSELPTDEEVESLCDLFNPVKAINRRFERTSFDRLTIKGDKVYLDGDEVTNALTDQIMRFLADGEDFDPLVRFYEKVLSNTDDRNPEAAENSRQQLYRWLASRNFSIFPDGDILAYKAVDPVPADDSTWAPGHPWYGLGAEYRSTKYGPAIVDGIEGEGLVPQIPGSVVEMQRSAVTFDPNNACDSGLHISNWSYAKTTFGGWGASGGRVVMKVKVNPRDVVSITTDYGDSKMRTCRFEVIGLTDSEETAALVLPTPAAEPEPEVAAPTVSIPTVDENPAYSEDDEERCYDCGEFEDDCTCDEYDSEYKDDLARDDEDGESYSLMDDPASIIAANETESHYNPSEPAPVSRLRDWISRKRTK